MNPQQRKYALNRIEVLERIKIREAENKFTTPEVKVTNEEKYKLIAAGKVKIFPYEKIIRNHYSCPDLYPSFDFSAYEKAAVLDKKKFEAIRNEVSDLAQRAKDQIMLGDCNEAIKIIEKLEAIKI